jgi:hypothetical protein
VRRTAACSETHIEEVGTSSWAHGEASGTIHTKEAGTEHTKEADASS